MKECGNNIYILQTERQQPVALAMVELHQMSIYTSEVTLVVPLSRHKSSINNSN